MIYIIKKKLKKENKFILELTKIRGLGKQRIKKLADILAINLSKKLYEINKKKINKLNKILEHSYLLESLLIRKKLRNIAKLKKIKSIKGARHKLGLPVRGQRTHTNAGTQYRLKNKKARGKIKTKKK